MKKTATAVFVAALAIAALGGCAKKLQPGVLSGGQHVPPPPSEQHRVTSRVVPEAAPAAPAAAQPAAGSRLSAPAAR